MYIANVLQPLIDACQWILEFWHDLIGDFPGSWGWSIILLTFTVRIAILPLTFKGVKSMQRLQTLQPKIKEIQARYKDDKQRMNQEVMAFYQREKVNPLGSCLPLLLQIPFFISLFSLLRRPLQGGHREQPGLRPDRQPRREGHRPGPARRPDRALRGYAARGQRRHGDQRGSDAAPHHVRAAVRIRRLHHQFPGGPDRLLDHDQRVDDRAAAAVKKMYPKPDPLDPRDAVTDSDTGARQAPWRRGCGGRRQRKCEGAGQGAGQGARRWRRVGQGAAAVAAQEEEALGAPALSSRDIRRRGEGRRRWARRSGRR